MCMEPEHYFPSPSLCSTRWWSKETVAVVTGGNKGIGFALVKQFAELGLTVVLTARDYHKGQAALHALHQSHPLHANHIHFLLLDVSNPLSIKRFASSFQAKFGPTLDILVNNAGVSFNELDENTVEYAKTVMKTNFYGPKLLIEALFPLFRCYSSSSSSSISRVLNISSRLGSLNKLRNTKMREMLEREELEEEEIEEMVKRFLEDVKNGRWENEGWPLHWTDYSVSKLALNAYSRVLAKRQIRLSVNCFCPGFTQTSMTRGKGTHTADHAASLAATLALLPPCHLPTGKFFLLGKTNTTTSKL
ncbi:hypothetical protein PIB30_070902 [Stylosanthes scabra]|uniref:(+)-neomenthol dehydrogenase n=1 Tax=Stylosanthes scabra TaxID=79078 RepID=A0ABU6RPU5_9FABA|nr:hypothetical protein [Stylosanthes scabra]